MIKVFELATVLAEVTMKVVSSDLQSPGPFMGFRDNISKIELFPLRGGLSGEFVEKLSQFVALMEEVHD